MKANRHHIPNIRQKRLRLKLMKREYEGCFIPIKQKVNQEDSIILNICEPNLGTQTLINKSIPIIKDEDLHQSINSRWFCIPLHAIEKLCEQKHTKKHEN